MSNSGRKNSLLTERSLEQDQMPTGGPPGGPPGGDGEGVEDGNK